MIPMHKAATEEINPPSKTTITISLFYIQATYSIEKCQQNNLLAFLVFYLVPLHKHLL